MGNLENCCYARELPSLSITATSVGYSLFSGLNSVFGSHLVTPDGYLLNNAMANFYTNSTLPNSNVETGQKPLQMMLPLIAVETKRRCGARLVSASSDATILAQVVMNFLEFNSTVAESMRSSGSRLGLRVMPCSWKMIILKI